MKKSQNKMRVNADDIIVRRVKNYLAENVNQTYVDVSQMARSLRDKYREYSNRNEAAFLQLVEAAYEIVAKKCGMDGGYSSSENSEDMDEMDDCNQELNNRLLAMYQKQDKQHPQQKKKALLPPNEPINLSSDDDSVSATPKLPKLGNQITIIPHSLNKAKHSNNTIQENNMKSNDRKRKPDTTKTPALKRNKTEDVYRVSNVNFENVGGISEIATQLCDLILHMKHPEVYKRLGVKVPRGALLHGPPGTGKTLIANAISGKLNIPIISVPGTELVGGVSGESEERIRDLFEKASMMSPCILFIDEIDAICGNRMNAQKDMERRMVAQLLSSIDSLDKEYSQVLILAATNNPDSLDPALRRAGRLEQEIAIGIPSVKARKEILEIITANIVKNDDVDFNELAKLTPGFVGADLQALVNKACTVAIKRVFEKFNHKIDKPTEDIEKPLNGESNEEKAEEKEATVETLTETSETPDENPTVVPDEVESNVEKESSVATEEPEQPKEVPVQVTKVNPVKDVFEVLDSTKPFTAEQLSEMTISQEDFLQALKTVKPCAIREGIITVPDVTWSDVGSLKNIRKELQLSVLAPVKYPEQLKKLGLSVPSGILLCGPPGCGKTLLAKAVANEAGINFISVKGPELLNMYVGESEKAVRTCFQRARNSAPCVIFFDEFDSLCPRRNQNDNNGATRVVNQLLTEMDGIESREGVFVLAASNRPDIIDPAVLRPGRLDRVIYVGMPEQEDRVDILKKLTKDGTRPLLADDVNLETVALWTDNFTGADLAGLIRQASTLALTHHISEGTIEGDINVKFEHFREALSKCKPSVSAKEQQHYEKLRLKYTSDDRNDNAMETEPLNEESMETV